MWNPPDPTDYADPLECFEYASPALVAICDEPIPF
jgi:hypothetical protein